jgi:membrane protein
MIATKEMMSKISRDNITNLSAALSYYTALSLAPLLILMVTLLSTIGHGFQEKMVSEVQGLVGTQAAKAIDMIIDNAKQKPDLRTGAGIIGIVTLLFSASVIFGQLRSSLNMIFEIQTPPRPDDKIPWYRKILFTFRGKLLTMGLVLSFVFIAIVSLIVSSGVSLYLSKLEGTEELIGQIINYSVSLIIFTLLFAAIFYFVPSKRISKKVAMLSGLLTAILFNIGKTLIGIYIGKSAVGSAYGAAGSLIVLLVWVYYSSAIIFICAEAAFQLNKRWAGGLKTPEKKT